MRVRWFWWVLAAAPALAGVVSLQLGVGDFRSSGLVLGISMTVGLAALLLLWRRPWSGSDRGWKWLAAVPGLLLGLVALLGLSEGLPEFLQARRLFLDVNSRGPRAMVAFDGGFLLAGTDGSSGLLWVSDDGSGWTQIEDPVFDGVSLQDLLVVESGLLAVGEAADPSEAVVLSSVDGTHWQVVGRFGNSDHGTVPLEISQSGEHLVVIANIIGNDVEFYRTIDASSWTVSEPTPVFDDGENGLDIACSETLCVGVGFHDAAYREEIDANSGVAWVSTTGAGYQLVDHDFNAERLQSVTWAAPGFIAVGNTPANQGIAWQSQDGESWTSLMGSFNEMTITGVAATEDGYMIFGHNSDTGEILVWASSTGDEWREESISDELAEGSLIRTIAHHGDIRIAAGTESDTLDTFIWTSTSNQPWQHTMTFQSR